MLEKLKGFASANKIGRQSVFLGLAALMCIIVGGFAIYVITSLASDLNNALSVPSAPSSAVKFDIQGFEDLKLIH